MPTDYAALVGIITGISDLLSTMSNRTAREKERKWKVGSSASRIDGDEIGQNKVPLRLSM